MFDRPKSGFAIPLARWLRGELREWADALLDPVAIRREGYFAVTQIERRWRQHVRAQMDWSFHLWGVLMFQAWLEDFHRHSTSPNPSPRRDVQAPRVVFAHTAGPQCL